MPIAHEFDYVKPTSFAEVVEILAERGEAARVLAGGTDLVPSLRDELVAPEIVVDLKGIEGASDLALVGGGLLLGPLVTFADLLESVDVRAAFPLIHEMASVMGCRGVRNRATVVGNICSGVPSCDAGSVLLVHEARVLVLGPTRERTIPIDDWFVGPKETALRVGQVVIGIEVPPVTKDCAGAYVKLRRYRGEDLAQASVAVLITADQEYRVAFGAVAPTPVRAKRVESALRGEELTDDLIEKVVKLIPDVTRPITDIRSTARYRSHMLGVMLERGLRAAASRLAGGGPAYGTEHI